MGALISKDHLDDLASRINAAHAARESAWESTLMHARTAGALLIDAKAAIGHGGFASWIMANCSFSERTAQVYMQIARSWARLSSNPQHVAEMSLRKAVEMISPPTPKAAPAQEVRIAPPAQAHAVAGAAQQSAPERRASSSPPANLRREPTPEESAENEMRERLSRVVVSHIQDWHRENRNATTELICDALRDVVIQLQDGEVDLDGGGS